MYRYQQRQWLQRQQMQEEEERERLQRLRSQQADIQLSQDERKTLESQYHQQPVRLLNPTNYHLQQTTRSSGVIPRPEGTSPRLNPQQQQQQQQQQMQMQMQFQQQQQQMQFQQSSDAPPFLKHEQEALFGSDSFVVPLDSSHLMDADSFLRDDSVAAMDSDLPGSPTSSLDVPFSPATTDPLTFLDLEQPMPEGFVLSTNGTPEALTTTGKVADATQPQPIAVPPPTAPMSVSSPMNDMMPPPPNSWTAPSSLPASLQHGGMMATPFTAPPGNYQFQFSSSVPNSFGIDGKQSEADMWAAEKRRRRRESHNAVERRRRDNINDRITELSLLVPDCVDESNPNAKPNKGIILRKSADYIRYLQEANRRLQRQVSAANGGQLPDSLSKELDGLNRSFLEGTASGTASVRSQSPESDAD